MKRHFIDQFDPLKPLDSFEYSLKVADVIKNDELNIIEGGSPFYVKAIL